ncbi:Phage P22-like portal protein [uncultured Caudovirales phage]|uniref:Phage P22-like portal protein n=1 Tax=uncultured Caudovirales phage TaxID=2100421 RepID=A0A6J5N1Y8_9CAUD|nr:Phage P22-like portal protein [uncultured Caudovirales phage]
MAEETKKSIVEIARARYQRTKDLVGTLREQAIADTRFVMGDSDNQWQWPEDVYTSRAAVSGKPCLTINVTAQHCNQIINAIRQNRPSAKISPVDGEADKKTALILGGMLRSIQAYSNADTAHDTAAEHAVYGGEGYWRVLTEYESDESFDQVITIKPLVNPQLVYIDPDAIEPDRSDAKWGMIFEDMGKDQFREEYPDLDMSSWVEDPNGWNSADRVRIAEYFYCESEEDTLIKLQDSSIVRVSELPEGVKIYGESLVSSDGQQVAIVAKRKTTKKVWYWCKLIGGEDKPTDKRVWPGQYLPIITVVGKELNVNGEIVRKGVVRDLKDSGRMVNYSYSAAVETLALQSKVPYMASAEAISGFEDIWGSANIENRAYLPYNERDMEGNALSMPQRQAPAMMATAQVQMLQLSTEQMRASSGQQNANFGIKSEAQSGVGIQRLKAQGEIATFHFPDNLARALKYEARVILDLIPKVYDTRRVVRILGLDGKETAAVINPEMESPHEELDNVDGDIKEAFNPLVGRYDVAIDTGPSYQTQRQEAADTLTELTTRNPQLMQMAGDLIMRSYDFPMADEVADRLAKALPPDLQDHKGNQDMPPEVKQAMDQMGQQMDMLTKELHDSADKIEELQEGAEIKKQELIIKAYDSETKRIQALGTGMNPEQVQALVMQTVQSALITPAPAPQIYEDMQESEQEEAQHQMPPDDLEPMHEMQPTENPPSAGFSLPESQPQG